MSVVATPHAAPAPTLPNRIVSLDQFRGYTVFGMFIVNFMGSFKLATPNILLHHHTHCSYADLIMPHFLFCVGYAFRLTFGRRDYKDGPRKAYTRVVKRILGLMLVAFSVYHVSRVAPSWEAFTQMTFWDVMLKPMKSTWLQTLGHIALTSLWILPWLRTSIPTRIAFMVASGLAHHIACYYGYFLWVNTSPNGVDGGPLGFLTWTIPAILGTIVCDWVVDAREANEHAPLKKMLIWSVIIMLLGWFITWPSRAYDITPQQMEVLKEEGYDHRERVKAHIGAMNAPLNESLKPFNKIVSDLNSKTTDLDYEKKQEIMNRRMVENGLDPERDYSTAWINYKTIDEWETKYLENYEGELGALHEKLDYYEEAIEPDRIDPSPSQEAQKIEIARLYEKIVTAEIERKQEIRNAVLTEAGLDPATEQPTKELNQQIDERLNEARPEIEPELRAELAELKPIYIEQLSPYYEDLQEARGRLTSSEESSAEGEKSEQQLLVENLEARMEIDWNQLASYGWRDLKLAEHPVAFDVSAWWNQPWSEKIGRFPLATPPYQDKRIVRDHPRDGFYWNAWMMSQRAGTVAYPTFAAGASLFLYLLFYIACDMWGWQVPLFRTFGTNALAAYCLYMFTCRAVKYFIPSDTVWWYGWTMWLIAMFLIWVVIRNLEKNKIYVRM